jgi:hypothetical protein
MTRSNTKAESVEVSFVLLRVLGGEGFAVLIWRRAEMDLFDETKLLDAYSY